MTSLFSQKANIPISERETLVKILSSLIVSTQWVFEGIHPKSPGEDNFPYLDLNHSVCNAYTLLLIIGVSSGQFNTGLI